MEHSKTPDWRIIASEEHEQRKKIEMQMEGHIDALVVAQQALKTATSYNQFLESKFNDAEAKCAAQATKLYQAIEMLKKSKALISKRKQEIAMLRDENAKLKAALEKKSAVLQNEMLEHERTKYKFSLSNTPTPIAISKNKAKVSSDALDQYFAHKLLSDPNAKPGNYEKALQEDTDFMAQLLYIDKQFKKSQA